MASIPTRFFIWLFLLRSGDIGAEDEATGDLPVLEARVRRRRRVERQDLGDERGEVTVMRELERGLELALRRRVRADDLELLDDHEPGVEIDRAALEVADDDHAAAGRHRLERLRER